MVDVVRAGGKVVMVMPPTRCPCRPKNDLDGLVDLAAGIQKRCRPWTPAFAGVTSQRTSDSLTLVLPDFDSLVDLGTAVPIPAMCVPIPDSRSPISGL